MLNKRRNSSVTRQILMQYFMINYLYCKLRHFLLSQSLDMFLSDSVDFSCLIAKSVGQYNAQNDIFLANITRTQIRNRILSCSFGATQPMTSQSSLTFEVIFQKMFPRWRRNWPKHKVCMHFTRRLKCSRRK